MNPIVLFTCNVFIALGVHFMYPELRGLSLAVFGALGLVSCVISELINCLACKATKRESHD